MKPIPLRSWRQRFRRQSGAGLVESIVVFPLLLFTVLAVMQAAMVFFAKSSVNYASYEAARSASVANASISSIYRGFQMALLPYYGGGRTADELTATARTIATDLEDSAVRVEILSPTQESFSDYNSPKLQDAYETSSPVIPNAALDQLSCPRDVPGCKSDPKTNASGQTLLDANVLKLRITYGIPPAKQMPMVGRFYTWALGRLNVDEGDAFKQALISAGRIPVVTHTVMRMQSDPIQNALMASSPGPGNDGKPVDPGPGPTPGSGPGSGPGSDPSGPGGTPSLPSCPWWDPSCASCPDGMTGTCKPDPCTALISPDLDHDAVPTQRAAFS